MYKIYSHSVLISTHASLRDAETALARLCNMDVAGAMSYRVVA
jgi:hypothetical protein